METIDGLAKRIEAAPFSGTLKRTMQKLIFDPCLPAVVSRDMAVAQRAQFCNGTHQRIGNGYPRR